MPKIKQPFGWERKGGPEQKVRSTYERRNPDDVGGLDLRPGTTQVSQDPKINERGKGRMFLSRKGLKFKSEA